MNELRKKIFFLGLCVFVTAVSLHLWSPEIVRGQNKPLTYPEIITALNSKLPNSAFKNKAALISWLIAQVRQRRVEKSLSQEMEGTLRESGATDELIRTIRQNVPVGGTPVRPSAPYKAYAEMTDAEKDQFIESKVGDFLNKFGQSDNNRVSAEGIGLIRASLDGYLRRLSIVESVENDNKAAPGNCNFARGNLTSIFRRGTQYSPAIAEAFVKKGVEPEIGIYVGFLESEFCPCLQGATGPLGMFQFTRAVGKQYGLTVEEDASPTNPDQRCNPKNASIAAASYFNVLTDRHYGADANGILFAVAAYNSGEGSLNRNIRVLRELGQNNVTFWELVANKAKLSAQFQSENYQYVPKFLAAMIIGENPKTFGIVEFQPLSSQAPKLTAAEAQTRIADNEMTAFWKKQRNKALEDRRQPTGRDIKGVVIPPELAAGQTKQANALNQMKSDGFTAPMDFLELAQRNLTGEFVELPLATENYVVDLSGFASDEEFRKFSFPDGKKSSSPDSAEFGNLKRYLEKVGGQNYDLDDPSDRAKIRQRLLRMLAPKALVVLEEIARQYQAKFKRPLRVTSMIRSIDYQVELNQVDPGSFLVRGADSLPPHCSGLAFDIPFRQLTAEEQNFLAGLLAKMDREGKIEALRESGDSVVFHVFVL